MKKRISISVLTLLFLVSTTGLPIWTHYCEMMGKRTNNKCEMCKAEMQKAETSCCSEDVNNNVLKLSTEKPICCIQEFDYKKIEDNFSQPITVKLIVANDVAGKLIDEVINPKNEKAQSYLNTYNLPPPKFGKQLLQTIHQLKIDLPLC